MRQIQSLPSSVEALFRDAEVDSTLAKQVATPPLQLVKAETPKIQSEIAGNLAQRQIEVAAAESAIHYGHRGFQIEEVHREQFMVERDVLLQGDSFGKKHIPATRVKTITRTYKTI